MRLQRALCISAVTILAVGTSRADFKYTQQTKVTGGALVGVTKSLGVFSKSARQVTAPQTSTIMVHGNRLRTEHTTGDVEIIDLDGRRFIHIDPAKKTYSVQTFEQMKAQVAQAQEKLKTEQTKAAAKQDNPQSVTMVPKFDIQATGQSRVVLDVTAKEMKMRMDLLFKSTDPKTQADLEKSNGSYWMTADSWYGTIPGYEEVKQFYTKMAKELDWVPGSMGMGMGMANPQMTQAAAEFKKNAVKMEGMPLVEFSSFGMAANGQAGANGQQPDNTQQPQQNTASNDSTPTNPRDAIAKGLGGIFGKKKQKDQQSDTPANTGAASAVPAPAPVPGSMMDMVTEVMSYSKDSLDGSLFDIPAGYTQIQMENGAK